MRDIQVSLDEGGIICVKHYRSTVLYRVQQSSSSPFTECFKNQTVDIRFFAVVLFPKFPSQQSCYLIFQKNSIFNIEEIIPLSHLWLNINGKENTNH